MARRVRFSMSVLSKVVEYFFGITGLLFLFSGIGMTFDPEYSNSAPGAIVLAVPCFIIAALARFRWGVKKSMPADPGIRYAGVSREGSHAFCEHCGAQWMGWGEVCKTCGRRSSSARMRQATVNHGGQSATLRRISLPQKLRYEVLRRDGFTCQYCGRKPPEVELEVDHIEPVSAGGRNEAGNLITSCKDCNRGKGKDDLLHQPHATRPHVVVQREIREREIVKIRCRYCGSLNPEGGGKCSSCGAIL